MFVSLVDYVFHGHSLRWRIQTGAMGCRKPMKTANLNLIQYIIFFCKNNKQGDDDSIFRRADNFVQIRENSYQTSCVEASCQGDWLFASCDQLR